MGIIVESTALTLATTAASTHTINAPSGVVSGSRVIGIFGADESPVIDLPAGWEDIADLIQAGSTPNRHKIAYFDAAGSMADFDLELDSDTTSEEITAYLLRLSGHHADAPEAGTPANISTSGDPNHPSVTASWGQHVDNFFMAIALGSKGGRSVNAWPLPDNNFSEDGHGNEAPLLAFSSDVLNQATLDPGVTDLSFGSSYTAHTIVMKPDTYSAGVTKLRRVGLGGELSRS